MTEPGSRRDRVRAATTREITQTARRLLVEHGAEAMTLRAIAREMGMTAPGLYRYFASHDELYRQLCADLLTELTDDVQAAMHAAPPGLTNRFAAAAWAFRAWAMRNPREFHLLFGEGAGGIVTDVACTRFARTFFALFEELWTEHQFPVPAPDQIEPELRDQLDAYGQRLDTSLPVGAILIFVTCWIRLYGIVSLEVFGSLRFALDDAEPMFRLTLAEMARMVGLDERPIEPPAEEPPAGSGNSAP